MRVTDPEIVDGVAVKMAEKYAGGAQPDTVAQIERSIADGDTWIFELAPRDA